MAVIALSPMFTSLTIYEASVLPPPLPIGISTLDNNSSALLSGSFFHLV